MLRFRVGSGVGGWELRAHGLRVEDKTKEIQAAAARECGHVAVRAPTPSCRPSPHLAPSDAVTLFLPSQEDKDNLCNAVRNEVKGAGLLDSPDNCWDFFINKASTAPGGLGAWGPGGLGAWGPGGLGAWGWGAAPCLSCGSWCDWLLTAGLLGGSALTPPPSLWDVVAGQEVPARGAVLQPRG
jgi:hypothetical protein